MSETVVVTPANNVVVHGDSNTVEVPTPETVIVTNDNNIVVHEETLTVQIATPGLQGPPGPQGPAGSAGGTALIHVQGAPSTSWNIVHSFGREPNVVIVIDGAQVIADVVYPTSTTVVINFGEPQTGKAILT